MCSRHPDQTRRRPRIYLPVAGRWYRGKGGSSAALFICALTCSLDMCRSTPVFVDGGFLENGRDLKQAPGSLLEDFLVGVVSRQLPNQHAVLCLGTKVPDPLYKFHDRLRVQQAPDKSSLAR